MAATLQIALIKMLKTPSGPELRRRNVAEVAPRAPGDLEIPSRGARSIFPPSSERSPGVAASNLTLLAPLCPTAPPSHRRGNRLRSGKTLAQNGVATKRDVGGGSLGLCDQRPRLPPGRTGGGGWARSWSSLINPRSQDRGEAGLSLSACRAFKKGHHCLGPALWVGQSPLFPKWRRVLHTVPHRAPLGEEGGLLSGPEVWLSSSRTTGLGNVAGRASGVPRPCSSAPGPRGAGTPATPSPRGPPSSPGGPSSLLTPSSPLRPLPPTPLVPSVGRWVAGPAPCFTPCARTATQNKRPPASALRWFTGQRKVQS